MAADDRMPEGRSDPAATAPPDARAAAEPREEEETAPDPRRRIGLPLLLFVATCASTLFAGASHWEPFFSNAQAAWQAVLRYWPQGLLYMAAVMGILLTHEMGHFVLALRHRIPASLPYFIPVPFLPFGTMGAVIGMSGSGANRRQMFDLGIAGPLAGLVVAIPVACIGIQQLQPGSPTVSDFQMHPPLIFKLLAHVLRPGYEGDLILCPSTMNPFLMAGWVGMLITGLNMLPVSQLDGGHVAYALLGRRAHLLGRGLLVASILFVLVTEQYGWVLMIVLVTLIGTDHPPTADDRAPLGWPRRLLGWAAMSIPILCFPPMGITAQ